MWGGEVMDPTHGAMKLRHEWGTRLFIDILQTHLSAFGAKMGHPVSWLVERDRASDLSA
jgi:hypothetical protein